MNLKPGERQLSEPKEFSITGYLSPFREVRVAPCDQPVVIEMPNGEKFISVYSTEEKLHASMDLIGIANYKIKQIEDTIEFAESIYFGGYRLMVDPYRVPERNVTRWIELIVRDGKLWHYEA